MKKILLTIILVFSFIWNFFEVSAVNSNNCQFNDWDISSSFEDCFSSTPLVKSGDKWLSIRDWDLWDWLIELWTRISTYLWILAVISLVYAWFKFATSVWDDQEINKAKAIVKWTIFGLLWLVFASTIILVLIKLFYSI